MAGDEPIAGVRGPQRTSSVVRLQGLAVAALACLPLTASGHYAANTLTGSTTRAVDAAAVVVLVVLTFVGVVLVLTAVASLLPGWHRAGRGPVIALGAGVVFATLDYWTLLDSPTGLALNVAGVGVAAGALQTIYWTPRTPFTTIALRSSERVQEWFAGVLVLAGLLAFVLPHRSTVDGVAEDCSPLWVVVEQDCVTADVVWWPVPAAAIVLGVTLLFVIHHDASRTVRRGVPAQTTRRRSTVTEYRYRDLPPRPRRFSSRIRPRGRPGSRGG